MYETPTVDELKAKVQAMLDTLKQSYPKFGNVGTLQPFNTERLGLGEWAHSEDRALRALADRGIVSLSEGTQRSIGFNPKAAQEFIGAEIKVGPSIGSR